MNRSYLVVFLAFLVYSGQLVALHSIIIHDSLGSFQVKDDYVELYEDSTNKLELGYILKISKGNITGNKLANRNPECTYWLKFRINVISKTRELEQKVAKRTNQLNQKAKELEEANIKLAQQAEEINQWNQRLDLDNHQLKTKVKKAVEGQN